MFLLTKKYCENYNPTCLGKNTSYTMVIETIIIKICIIRAKPTCLPSRAGSFFPKTGNII